MTNPSYPTLSIYIWFFWALTACSSYTPMNHPFPTKSAFSQPELQKRFGVVTVEQDPDPAIHYKLIIPMQWGQVSGTRRLVTPAHPFELRSHFKSLSAPVAEAKVTVAYIPQEVSPSDWLAVYLDGQKEKVLHERHFPSPGGTVPDVLTQGGAPGQERISRWTVLKDHAKIGGAHFFMLQVSTGAGDYNADMANVFFVAISNFNVLHPNGWAYAEQLRTLVRAVPARISTAFPLSWEQQENPLSDEHLYQVKLTKKLAGRSIGLVNLMLTAGQSEADMRRVEEESRESYQQADQLEFAPAQLAPAPKFGTFDQVFTALTAQMHVPAGTPPQEREVLLARTGPYWVLLENVRFTRAANPEAWAVSKRGFEIVRDRLVVGP